METGNLIDHRSLANHELALPPQRKLLLGTQRHFKSNLFTSRISINPLIASANPLLFFITLLRETEHYNAIDTQQLLSMLKHEVLAFESNAYRANYRSPIIVAARYLLCAMVDEVLIKQGRLLTGNSAQAAGLLQEFYTEPEHEGDKRFFSIVEHACEDPMIHLDLLELSYICLSLGFRGKYQTTSDWSGLENTRENLHRLIRHHRQYLQEEKSSLFSNNPIQSRKNAEKRQIFSPPLLATFTVSLSLVGTIFYSYWHHFNNLIQPLYHHLTQVF